MLIGLKELSFRLITLLSLFSLNSKRETFRVSKHFPEGVCVFCVAELRFSLSLSLSLSLFLSKKVPPNPTIRQEI